MTMPDPTVHADFGVAPGEGLTMLDGLLADLDEHPTLNDTIDLPIPRRPGWAVRCSTDLPYESLAAWRKAAHDPALGGTNELKLGSTLLVAQCTAVLLNDEPVTVNGDRITFHSPSLQARLGVDRPVDAVRKFFHGDGFLAAAANTLLREAGYGSESTPTRR